MGSKIVFYCDCCGEEITFPADRRRGAAAVSHSINVFDGKSFAITVCITHSGYKDKEIHLCNDCFVRLLEVAVKNWRGEFAEVVQG